MTTSPSPLPALLPGGRTDLSAHADGVVIENLALFRSDEGTYWAAASRSLNLALLLAPVLEEHSAAGQPEFLNRYERLIGDFFQQRYGAELTGEAWDTECAEFSAPVQDTPDAENTLQAAWSGTDIMLLNEDIKFNRLAALIADRIRASVSLANRNASFGAVRRLNAVQEAAMADGKYGEDVSDECAVVLARTLAAEGSFPGLRALGAAGYTDFGTISRDLDKVRTQDGTGPSVRRRADMLANWASAARAA